MITKNNERTVEKALESVKWADEIVVVDSFSTDKTLEICRKFTDKVFQREWPGHRDQYQHAADLTTNQWIMFVDSDEEISYELAREIRDELNSSEERYDGYIANRCTYYLGKWIMHGGWHPDCEVRIHKRDKGEWKNGVHARIVVHGRTKYLKNPYRHYTYKDISDQIQTIDKYSEISAHDMKNDGKSFSFLKLLFNPPFRFIKEYIFKRGFMDGLAGLIIAVSTMFYVFIKYAKLWELERKCGWEEKGKRAQDG
jgi:glycosyltransferase involved in cell wall biosynthesis